MLRPMPGSRSRASWINGPTRTSRAALSCILNDPQYRHAAAKVADEIEAMPAPADHVATIEALVG